MTRSLAKTYIEHKCRPSELRISLDLSGPAMSELTGFDQRTIHLAEQDSRTIDPSLRPAISLALLKAAHEMATSGRLPSMVDSANKTATILRFRKGLDMSSQEAATILRVQSAELRRLESSLTVAEPGQREAIWAAYANWAWARHLKQVKRDAAAIAKDARERERRRKEQILRELDAAKPAHRFVQAQQEAYLSKAAIERKVLRFVGVEESEAG